MAITRGAWEQAQRNSIMMDAILQYAAMESGQKRIDAWLREHGLEEKVAVGVVAVWDDCYQNELEAWAKVVVKGSGARGAFEHRESPYINFPSDAFLTKILLVAG